MVSKVMYRKATTMRRPRMADKTIHDLVNERIAAESRLYEECFNLGRYGGEVVKDTEYEGVRQLLETTRPKR